MNDRIHDLMGQIAVLEGELQTALHERQGRVLFYLRGRRIEFEAGVRETQRRLKRNFFRWLVTDRPQNLITGPIIYGLIVPMVLLDLTVSLYQALCFPVYRIARVRRGDYIAFDRHQLGYLNFIEQFHCEYCAYGNGLLAYATEIIARTEQYFAPSSTRTRCWARMRATATFSITARTATIIKSWSNFAAPLPTKRPQLARRPGRLRLVHLLRLPRLQRLPGPRPPAPG